MWRFVLAENIPAGVAENFLILRCGATSPCAVTSKPLVCCGVKPAAANRNMKALLEATAAIRTVRRNIALGFRLQRCVWLKVPPLAAQSVPRLTHERENPRLTRLFFALCHESGLSEGPQTDGIPDQFRSASDLGPTDGFLELSAFARVSRAEWWGQKAPIQDCRSLALRGGAVLSTTDPVATRGNAWAPLVALAQHCLSSGRQARSPTPPL